jgi:hypothetical protein
MNLAVTPSLLSYFSILAISSAGANPFNTTFAPAADRDFAMPNPIPLSEPVTKAVLPLRNGTNILTNLYKINY